MKKTAMLGVGLLAAALVAVIWLWTGPGAPAAAHAAPPEPSGIPLTAADDGRTVVVAPGQVLEVTLDANPSAGYVWQAKAVGGVLRQIGVSQFKPTMPPIMGRFPALGAPGKVTLRFAVVQPGAAVLNLVKTRPWDISAASSDTLSLQVQSEGEVPSDLGDLLAAESPSMAAPADLGATEVLGLPASFNWCDQGGCAPVRDQGACGSCWAFGTVGPLESALLIQDGVQKNLSEQYLVSCNFSGWSCSGGWWAHDYHWWAVPTGEPGAGARYESDFAYAAANLPCNPPHTAREALSGWAYVGSSWEVPSVASIKQAIYDHGPVAAAVCVGSAFSGYRGGIFTTNETCSGTVNHAIVLTGWNDADQVWYLRNSWGSGWGEGGNMRIRWGTSMVGYSANYVTYQGNGGGSGPAAPTGLTAQAVGAERVDLAWTDNSSDEDGFKIEWSADGGSTWSQIATVAANVTTFSDTAGPFICGGSYWYRLRAFNAAADSAASNLAGVTMTDCSGCRDDYEPDDAAGQAAQLSVNGPAQRRTFHVPGDRDWARVSLVAGRPYTFTTSNLGASNDTVLYLYDRNGTTLLASNDDYGGTLASRLAWTPGVSGDYYVMVRHYFSSYGGCIGFEYDLTANGALVAPTGVAASDGAFTDRVRVTWEAVGGASSYRVYVATSATGTKTLLATTELTQLDHTSGSVNTVYYYWVTACVGTQCSGYSSYDTGWRAAILAPTDVQASDGVHLDKVSVSWSSVSGATGYQVYYATTPTGSRVYLANVATTAFNHTGATPGSLYYYWIKACLGSLCSAFSEHDSGWRGLAAPGNVQASDGSYTDRVRITWAAVAGGTKYEVYWTTVATTTRTLLLTATSAAADHLSASWGITYTYWVRACGNANCGDFGGGDTGWRAVSPPTGVQASDGTYADRVRIGWQPVTGATGYQVYSATSLYGVKSLVGSTGDLAFDDTVAAPGRTTWYWVKACAGVLCSGFSAYDTGWRGYVGAPLGVRASDGTYQDRVRVTWLPVEGASVYRVYYATKASGTKVLLASPVITEFNHTAARPGVTYYYYWVSACDGAQCSGYSAYDTGWRSGIRVALETPELTASSGSYTDCVRLSWRPVPEATVYQVERTVSPEDERTSVGSTVETAFDDLTAEPGVDYTYRVTPCTDEGCGEEVQEATGWRGMVPPEALQAALTDAGDTVLLSWAPSQWASFYRVSRAARGEAMPQPLGTTATTDFEDRTLGLGGALTYWVQGCTAAHCSDYSLPAALPGHFTYLPVVVKE